MFFKPISQREICSTKYRITLNVIAFIVIALNVIALNVIAFVTAFTLNVKCIYVGHEIFMPDINA